MPEWPASCRDGMARTFLSGLPPLQRSVVLLGVLVSTGVTYVACGGGDRSFGDQQPDNNGGAMGTGGDGTSGSGNGGGQSSKGGSGQGGHAGGGGGGAKGGSSGLSGGGGGASGSTSGGGTQGGGGGNPKDSSISDGPSSNTD